jgi:hypothetical protein
MTKPRLPITARDPIMRAIFAEADAQGISIVDLAKRAGLDHHAVTRMRRPDNGSFGAKIESAYRLASAVQMEVIVRKMRETE